jgi:multidrug efflux pump subunit AcrA (membrane-fusion protein)
MSSENISPSPAIQSETEEKLLSPDSNLTPGVKSPKSPRRFLLPALMVLALLGGVGWIVFSRVIMPMLMFANMPPQVTKVGLSTPKTGAIEDASEYAASLDSRQSVTLQPRVSGQVSTIFVKAGDRVAAGQAILQIDAADQRAQVASRAAAADAAAAEVSAAQADVANAIDSVNSLQARRASALANVQLNQREYARYLDLFNQGASSRQILDQKQNALQTAQADLRQAEADIRAQQATISRNRATVARNQQSLQQAQATVVEGQAQLQFYTITAPFSGIVGDIPVKQGDFVSNATSMLTITQNDQLDVIIQVPMEEAGKLRLGLPVKLLGDRGQVVQTGRISFIAPNVDPGTQTVQVKAAFANASNLLRTAQFARARIVQATRSGVLVPTSAMVRLAGKDFVFVAEPYSASGCEANAAAAGGPPGAPKPEPTALVAVQKPVQLGKIIGNDQEVISGVEQGDRIVTTGILQLQNCLPITE